MLLFILYVKLIKEHPFSFSENAYLKETWHWRLRWGEIPPPLPRPLCVQMLTFRDCELYVTSVIPSIGLYTKSVPSTVVASVSQSMVTVPSCLIFLLPLFQ